MRLTKRWCDGIDCPYYTCKINPRRIPKTQKEAIFLIEIRGCCRRYIKWVYELVKKERNI